MLDTCLSLEPMNYLGRHDKGTLCLFGGKDQIKAGLIGVGQTSSTALYSTVNEKHGVSIFPSLRKLENIIWKIHLFLFKKCLWYLLSMQGAS